MPYSGAFRETTGESEPDLVLESRLNQTKYFVKEFVSMIF